MLFFSPIVPMPLGNGAARRKFGAAERRAAEVRPPGIPPWTPRALGSAPGALRTPPGRPRGEQTRCLYIKIDTPPGDRGDPWDTTVSTNRGNPLGAV